MMPLSCSSRNPEVLIRTKTEYVFGPEEYLEPTPEPSIESYPKLNDGLARLLIATKKALRAANNDKAAYRRYLELKKSEVPAE